MEAMLNPVTEKKNKINKKDGNEKFMLNSYLYVLGASAAFNTTLCLDKRPPSSKELLYD